MRGSKQDIPSVLVSVELEFFSVQQWHKFGIAGPMLKYMPSNISNVICHILSSFPLKELLLSSCLTMGRDILSGFKIFLIFQMR